MQNYAQLLLLLLLFSVSQQKTKTNKEIKVFPPKQEEIRWMELAFATAVVVAVAAATRREKKENCLRKARDNMGAVCAAVAASL